MSKSKRCVLSFGSSHFGPNPNVGIFKLNRGWRLCRELGCLCIGVCILWAGWTIASATANQGDDGFNRGVAVAGLALQAYDACRK